MERLAIFEAHKKGGSGPKAAALLAEGWNGLPPLHVPHQTLREIARQVAAERDELYGSTIEGLSVSEGAEHLLRRCLNIADRETSRLDNAQRKGKLPAQQLDHLARAIERIGKALAAPKPRKPRGKAEDPDPPEPQPDTPTPPSFAEALLDQDREETPDPPPAPEAADVIVNATGTVSGPRPIAGPQSPLSDDPSARRQRAVSSAPNPQEDQGAHAPPTPQGPGQAQRPARSAVPG